MALTAQAKARLVSALTRKGLAEEFEAAMITPAPLSKKLKAAILSMMARKDAAEELIAALETVGAQALGKDADKRLENAVTRKKAAKEIKDVI